jgi:hypothetical protein
VYLQYGVRRGRTHLSSRGLRPEFPVCQQPKTITSPKKFLFAHFKKILSTNGLHTFTHYGYVLVQYVNLCIILCEHNNAISFDRSVGKSSSGVYRKRLHKTRAQDHGA